MDLIDKNLVQGEYVFARSWRRIFRDNDNSSRFSWYLECKEKFWNKSFVFNPPKAIDRVVSRE